MAVSIKHKFVSGKADDADTSLVRPTNWNDDHDLTGLGTGVVTFLETPSSANLASAVTDETGSGALVFGTSPTIGSPTISGGTINNATIGGTTAAAGSFTTLSASTSVTTPSVTNAGTLALSATGANSITLATNGSTRLTADSAGNLGLGVTPTSASWNGSKALEIGAAGNALVGWTGNNLSVLTGAYFSSGWKWAISNSLGAAQYEQYNGTHYWYVAAPLAHAAGDAITFTQAMTLDADGNLGIGATSPVGRVDIRKFNRADSTNSANLGVYTVTNPAVGIGGTLALGGRYELASGDMAPYASIRGGKENSTDANYNGYLAFQTIRNGEVLGERARIHASGGVSIGNTTDPGAANLSVSGQVTRLYTDVGTNTAAQALATNFASQVTISSNTTLTTTVPPAGTTARVVIISSGATSRTVTFGTGFAATGTLATGTAADRRFVVSFISDGTRLLETSRTAAITV
jgi:hypothetical protein